MVRQIFGKIPVGFCTRASGTSWPTALAIGAGEGIRTLDPDLGKVVLYP